MGPLVEKEKRKRKSNVLVNFYDGALGVSWNPELSSCQGRCTTRLGPSTHFCKPGVAFSTLSQRRHVVPAANVRTILRQHEKTCILHFSCWVWTTPGFIFTAMGAVYTPINISRY